jgi:hypothetical protein
MWKPLEAEQIKMLSAVSSLKLVLADYMDE